MRFLFFIKQKEKRILNSLPFDCILLISEYLEKKDFLKFRLLERNVEKAFCYDSFITKRFYFEFPENFKKLHKSLFISSIRITQNFLKNSEEFFSFLKYFPNIRCLSMLEKHFILEKELPKSIEELSIADFDESEILLVPSTLQSLTIFRNSFKMKDKPLKIIKELPKNLKKLHFFTPFESFFKDIFPLIEKQENLSDLRFILDEKWNYESTFHIPKSVKHATISFPMFYDDKPDLLKIETELESLSMKGIISKYLIVFNFENYSLSKITNLNISGFCIENFNQFVNSLPKVLKKFHIFRCKLFEKKIQDFQVAKVFNLCFPQAISVCFSSVEGFVFSIESLYQLNLHQYVKYLHLCDSNSGIKMTKTLSHLPSSLREFSIFGISDISPSLEFPKALYSFSVEKKTSEDFNPIDLIFLKTASQDMKFLSFKNVRTKNFQYLPQKIDVLNLYFFNEKPKTSDFKHIKVIKSLGLFYQITYTSDEKEFNQTFKKIFKRFPFKIEKI